MQFISLLPADTYTVINRSVVTTEDLKNIISLYEPIIGPIAVSLYFTLLRDLNFEDYISCDYSHHHLMAVMKSDIETIKLARESLEAIGLIKSYFKEGQPNTYVYEIYSPLNAKDFFNSPIFNVTLYNNVGKKEYEILKEEYEIPKIDLKEYEDISKEINVTYEPSATFEPVECRCKRSNSFKIKSNIDFDLLVSSIPKGLIKQTSLTKKVKELIEELGFIYNLDTIKMVEVLRMVITDKGTIDKEELRKQARKYYQYNNGGKLPTLIYRTQPEYLKTPEGNGSDLDKIIQLFETTSPYDFLRIKYRGAKPTAQDLKILESLMIDQELKPGVVNVLIDYVLKKNDNKLTKAFVDTIAGQWVRCKIETVSDAMDLARKENAKYEKKMNPTKTTKTKTNKPINTKVPIWFDETMEKEELSEEGLQELQELYKDYR